MGQGPQHGCQLFVGIVVPNKWLCTKTPANGDTNVDLVVQSVNFHCRKGSESVNLFVSRGAKTRLLAPNRKRHTGAFCDVCKGRKIRAILCKHSTVKIKNFYLKIWQLCTKDIINHGCDPSAIQTVEIKS